MAVAEVDNDCNMLSSMPRRLFGGLKLKIFQPLSSMPQC